MKISKQAYITYLKKDMLSLFLGCITWTSLSTFMLVARNSIGVTNIPILEVIIFIAGFVGVKIAFNNKLGLKGSVLLNIIIETVFLIAVYIALLTSDDLAMAGLMVYAIIIATAITNRIRNENTRHFEDGFMVNKSNKKALKILRKKEDSLILTGGVIGTSIALLSLTMFKIDLTSFTLVMLILNVVQNMYDYYIYNRYLVKV